MALLTEVMREMPSKRLVLSYVLDWVVIAAIAGIGAGWNNITPYHRPFSVTDLSISYPYTDEIIKTWILGVVAVIAPAGIIFLICLLLIPGPTAMRGTSKRSLLRRKLWEWNAGWLGLAMALATSFIATQGLKLVFGKPRPHLLSVCNPDLDDIAAHAVGSYATGFSREWVLVDSGICQQTDHEKLNDAFKSFPSGHASFSCAGLFYLSFFLASKFAVAIPFLPWSSSAGYTQLESNQDHNLLPLHQGSGRVKDSTTEEIDPVHHNRLQEQAAAPPVWTIVLPVVPAFTAIYICSTRYAQFYHFGFDIIAGATIGIVCAYVAFRFYHLPISRGGGWAWAARSRNRAFGIGVGTLGYVGPEGWAPARKQ